MSTTIMSSTRIIIPPRATTTTSGVPFVAPTGMLAMFAIVQGKAEGIQGEFPKDIKWGMPGYLMHNRGLVLLLVSTISIGVAFVFLVMRLWYRARLSRLSTDDWLMIPAFAFAAGCVVNSVWGVTRGGVGKHSYDLTYEELKNALVAFYLHLLLYIPGSSFAKLSVVFFVKRLAGATASRTINWLVYGNGSFIIVYNFILFFLQIFSCKPVRAGFYLPLRFHPETQCINYLPIYYAGSVCHTLSDIALLAAPIHLVLGLQMSRRNKIVVIGMLGVGVLAIMCTIIRMAFILNFTRGTDLPWDAINVSIWGHLEMAFAIIAGCAPALRPLFSRFLPSAMTSSGKATPNINRNSGWTGGKILSKSHGASGGGGGGGGGSGLGMKKQPEVSWQSVPRSRWSGLETRKDVKHGWEIGRGSDANLFDADIEMHKRIVASRGSEDAVSTKALTNVKPIAGPPLSPAQGRILLTTSVDVRYESDDGSDVGRASSARNRI